MQPTLSENSLTAAWERDPTAAEPALGTTAADPAAQQARTGSAEDSGRDQAASFS